MLDACRSTERRSDAGSDELGAPLGVTLLHLAGAFQKRTERELWSWTRSRLWLYYPICSLVSECILARRYDSVCRTLHDRLVGGTSKWHLWRLVPAYPQSLPILGLPLLRNPSAPQVCTRSMTKKPAMMMDCGVEFRVAQAVCTSVSHSLRA